MGQYCYLFDASALVALLLKNPDGDVKIAKGKILKLLANGRKNENSLFFVPNICMAEVSSALAKIFLADGYTEQRENSYRQHVEFLLEWVSSKKRHVIQTYALKRSHLVDIEHIFIADRKLPGRKGNPLSGHDGIIIAMGRVLGRTYGNGNVIILTLDGRMADVCVHNRDFFPHAIDLARQEIPGA